MIAKPILIELRAALIALLRAVDKALLDGYGWTPRCHTPDIDAYGRIERG